MSDILQKSVPYDVLSEARLPGVSPLEDGDWMRVDEAYEGQMSKRCALIGESRDDVIAQPAASMPAARELMACLLDNLTGREGFDVKGEVVICPDGRAVIADPDDPLGSIGQMVQEDFCILDKQEDEHVLIGAVLCFPSSWSLKDKMDRPLIAIHEPVGDYTAKMAARVQRLFDGVQVGRPLWRFNGLWYVDAELHQPRRDIDPRRVGAGQTAGRFLRSERQCMFRLPETRAVVFSIHTFVVAEADVL